METHLLFFGPLKEIAGGNRKLVLPDDVTTGEALIDWLSAGNDAVRAALCAPGIQMSIDQTIVSRDTPFQKPAEIAFLPPFSGG